MIAQNDFLRFLQNGTDERVKILRRIFDTGALKYFQENLKSRARKRSGELDECRRDFEDRGVDPYKRDEHFADWGTQIKADKATLAEADKNLGDYENQKTDLIAKIAVAEELSKKFTNLDTMRGAFERHAAKADEMKSLDECCTRGKSAFRVKPLADKAVETGEQYAEIQSDLTKAKTDAETAVAELEEAKKALAELPPLDEKQVTFDKLKHEWEQSTERLNRLKSLQSTYDDITKKETEFDTLQAELSEVLKTIEGLPPLAATQAAFGGLK